MYQELDAPSLFDRSVAHRAVRFHVEAYTSELADKLGITLPQTMGKAVAKRKAEYVAGRLCAMRAIEAQTGQVGVSIATGTSGAPVWPEGLVGSITHTHGFAAAALGDGKLFRGLGIDSEEIMTEKVMANVKARICRPDEAYGPQTPMTEQVYTTMIFSAKESLFKCLHALVGKMFWFEDARIEIVDHAAGIFQAELMTDLTQEFCRSVKLTGHFRVSAGLVHTGISLPVSG
ncbi:4'-phosphopantetheinyl transferase family protein [Allorhizobium terrae]|uniref:Enterobactin synthase component D n=1 Tax=Allorhizobium terrae TaxID=1848972 RepID=A0A4S3ZRM9_9HYPH|nr:4'-phosphopantetheinyl transferase superfamily protein [Allorhizobium terrae]THF48271.1 4'-phosphopantetheinyl transferase superfamily protein [Allorhizobium terrae]